MHDIITGITEVLVGSLITGFVWVMKFAIQAKKDIDSAHCKLREIEKQLKGRK